MRNADIRKFMCILLIFAFIFSGMCFDYQKADSIFSLISSGSITATLNSYDNLTSDLDVRVEEISTSRIISNLVKSEKRGEEKVSNNTVAYIAPSALFVHSSLFYHLTVTCGIFNNIHSNTVIVNYIHRQDGKKS